MSGKLGFTVTPFNDSLGAEVSGLDLSQPLDSAEIEALRETWLEHLVLLFRDQNLSDDNLAQFGRYFGELDLSPPNRSGQPWIPDQPYITNISNVTVNGMPTGGLGNSEAVWHTDMSYVEIPPVGSALYALEVPQTGGDTHFMSMYEAYQTLPSHLRERIWNKSCTHDGTYNTSGELRKGFKPPESPAESQGVLQPLVIVHPETQKKALFLGRRNNAYIVGLSLTESEEILDALWDHCQSKNFVLTHKWRVGDLLIWDNRCTMHHRDGFDNNVRRVMHRVQIKGDSAPIPAW